MKKLSIIASLFLGLGLLFGACSDKDDDNKVSEEWIAYQKEWVNDVITKKDDEGVKYFKALPSDLGEGRYIYWRPSNFIENNINGIFDKDEPNAFPKDKKAQVPVENPTAERLKYETDIAMVRFHGWYYNLEGKRVFFPNGSTEGANGSGKAVEMTPGGSIEGFRAALYDMYVGEERIICIPYSLGYGAYGSGAIPGYTTLFFDLKLLEIKK